MCEVPDMLTEMMEYIFYGILNDPSGDEALDSVIDQIFACSELTESSCNGSSYGCVWEYGSCASDGMAMFEECGIDMSSIPNDFEDFAPPVSTEPSPPSSPGTNYIPIPSNARALVCASAVAAVVAAIVF
jgi:hypothetical protein